MNLQRDKISSSIATAFIFVALFTQSAYAKIFIDINQVSNQSFPIAVVPPVRIKGDEDVLKLNEEFAKVVRNDLELMGIFRWIEPKAFLESPTKVAYTAPDIDFASWALLDALALVKGWYRVEGRKLTIEAHLFDVLAKTELVAKKYDVSIDQVSLVGHKFANEIMKVLTGEAGVFDTKIAFIGMPKGVKELCLMDFDGSNVQQLTSDKSIVLSPAWAPDGKSIFYTSFGGRGKPPQLYRYNVGSPPPFRISNFPGMTIGLSLHPIDPLLVTTLTKDGNSELYLLNMSGQIHKRLTTNNDIDVSATFSPDGKQVVFTSNRDGSAQIYKMNSDGSGIAQRLTFKGMNNTNPVWSPKGDKILFSGLDTDGHFDVFSMNVDSSGMVRLTYDTRNNEEPSWAPGGQLITFASNRTGTYQVWSMRPDGSKQMQLTREPWDHHMPAWGPRKR